MPESNTYKIKASCTFGQWRRYNVFITAACYDASGAMTDYRTLSDAADGGTMPEGSAPDRQTELLVPACHRMEIYLYVVANTLPGERTVRQSPPFERTLQVMQGRRAVLTRTIEVNQWGGTAAKFEI